MSILASESAEISELNSNVLGLSKPVICVVGPTASGKTDLAQRIALAINGEVVSADSMQIYKGMDIGTGKILPPDRMVKHWGLDLIDIGEPYSAALFQAYARKCFADIEARGSRSVLCGGTGFYVRAAIDDYQFPRGEQVQNPTRDRYQDFLEQNGVKALWEELNRVDPESAQLIPPADTKRVIRAFELLEAGMSYAAQKERLSNIKQVVPAAFIGLSVDAQILRDRIDKRVDAMFDSGLVHEVQCLLDSGFREGLTAPQAIGYKEVVSYIDGDISLDEAKDLIKVATHRYAKRQRTWFRKDPRIKWIDADSGDIEQIFSAACETLALDNQLKRSLDETRICKASRIG